MRWADLFRDLEAQFETAAAEELTGEVADRTRRELARIRLLDRLRAGGGRPVVATVAGAGAVHGELLDCGPDWLLLGGAPDEVLVPLSAVLGLAGLDRSLAAEPGTEGEVAARCGLGVALRALARDRAYVRCVRVDSSAVDGTIDRVGADHLELACHQPGERRRGEPMAFLLIPFAALGAVRRM